MGGNYLVELSRELPIMHCLVDDMQLYHNLKHIFTHQKY